MSLNKKAIREAMKARRRGVSFQTREHVGRSLSERLLSSHPLVREALSRQGPIAVYLASAEEIDLTDFISAARSSGCEIVAPRWNGGAYELVRLADEATCVTGPHGIREPPAGPVVPPQDVRVWLIPGLAFAKDGVRLGYGGGWYDRLLSGVPTSVPKLGIAYDFQLVEALPSEPHDVRMTEVVL